MSEVKRLSEFLKEPKKIVITTHHKPDADALGSSLAMGNYLKKKGHTVQVITPTDYPEFLYWMDGHDDVIIFEEQEAKSKEIIAESDMVFCLDFGSLKRINELGEIVRASDTVKVLMDHHQDPEDFAQYKFWSTKYAATAEIIYDVICDLGDKELIDKEIAKCIYAGIVTDTGSFRHPSTTRRVHEIASDIIDMGVDTSEIHRLVYDTNSIDKLRFLGYCLNEKLKVFKEHKTAYISVTDKELKKFNSKTGDTEGLVNYALSLKGVVFAVVIIDRVKAVKMSFRSVGTFSVAQFASDHFNGGGHFNAAGGMQEWPLQKVVDRFEELLPEYSKELNTIEG